MRFLILALSLTFSTQADAADIGWNTDAMGIGSAFAMQDASGVVTHVKRGARTFQVFDGMGRDADYLGSYTVNGRGEVVKMVARDGAVTRYEPHGCTRTVGQCRFVVTHPDGFEEPRTRVTTVTASGLVWEEHGLDGLIAEGALMIDGIGLAQHSWKKKKGQSKSKSRRIMIALK